MARYKIFFHNDMDGICSAAIFLHSTKSNYPGIRYQLFPVSSSQRGQQFDEQVTRERLKDDLCDIVILDYELHQEADFWFDHHRSHNSIPKQTCVFKYDPKALSATALVDAFFNSRQIDMVNYMNMIDSAGYTSITSLFQDKSPMMVLRAYVDKIVPSQHLFCRIVELLVSHDLDVREAIYSLGIDDGIVDEVRKAVCAADRHMVIYDNMSILQAMHTNQFPKYAEYYLYPKLKYAIRFTNTDKDSFYVNCGYNQWHTEKNLVDIGEVFRGVSYARTGGGHHDVGGCVVKRVDKERLIDDLNIALNDNYIDQEIVI